MQNEYMRELPDLRQNDTEITLEHCSVILERVSLALCAFDGQEGFDASGIDPSTLRDYYDDIMEVPQFNRLFSTETGKGVLAGIYIHWTMLRVEEAEKESYATQGY